MKTVRNNRLIYLAMGLSLSIPMFAQTTSAIPTYNISTVLGSYSLTDTSPSAPLINPVAVAVDGSGNVYFTDTYGNRVRRIDATTGAITTIAGDGTIGIFAQGNGSPAIKGKLWQPAGLVFDQAGNLYISDSFDQTVEKVDTNGVLSLFAGTATSNGVTANFAGDGLPANQARLRNPQRLAVDSQGNIYIADKENNRIRKVTTDGIIHTIAGVGSNNTTTAHAFSGDGGLAILAGLGQPQAVAVDSYGNVYIADTANNRIRMVAATNPLGAKLLDSKGQLLTDSSKIITTVVGGGSSSGADAPLNISLSAPAGLAVDSNNNVYIADTGNNRILYLNNNWSSCTLTIGGQTCTTSPTLTIVMTGLAAPTGLAIAGNELYIAEASGNRIRQLDIPSNTTTVLAQGQVFPILNAHGLAVDAKGNIFVADTGHQRIGEVPASGGTMAIIAGLTDSAGFPTAGGDLNPFAPIAALSSKVSGPWGGAFDALGTFYFADRGNNRVRAIDTSGNISTIAGGLSTPVPPTTSSKPPTASVAAGYAGDGLPAIQASLRSPAGVAVDNNGGSNACPAAPCIYIADSGNHVIRQVNSTGIITTFAGVAPACASGNTPSNGSCTGASGAEGDGLLAVDAQLNTPLAVAVDGKGNVYIADTQNHSVRKVDANTLIMTTIVGITSSEGRGGDNVLGENSASDSPVAVAADAAGNVFVAEGCNTTNTWGQCETSRIRRFDAATGLVTTLTSGINAQGLSTGTLAGDGGAASKALALVPTAITVDNNGNVYFADLTNRIRKLTPVPPATK